MVDGKNGVNGDRKKDRYRAKTTGIAKRRLYQNIILIHMIHEQKKDISSDGKTDFWVEKQNLSIHSSDRKNFSIRSSDRKFDLWLKGQNFHIAKWRNQSYPSIPKNAKQLLEAIQKSGFPEINKNTLNACLKELVDLEVLMKFRREGPEKHYNQVFYALPWAIKFGDDFQYRHYYIPWKLSVPKETMDELIKQ